MRERDGIEGEMALREEEIEPEARAAQESDGEGESEGSVEARFRWVRLGLGRSAQWKGERPGPARLPLLLFSLNQQEKNTNR